MSDERIKSLETDLAYANAQLQLVAVGRKRMMRRTVQASMQRDTLIQAMRDAVAARDTRPLEWVLAEIATGKGLWAPHTGTDRADTYREVRHG